MTVFNHFTLPGWLQAALLLLTVAIIRPTNSQVPEIGLPVLSLSAATYHTGEGGPAVVIINRSGDSSETVTVTCTTDGGTAAADSDFTSVTQIITFFAGETS